MLGLSNWLGQYKWMIIGLVALVAITASFVTGLKLGTDLTEGQYARDEVTRLSVEATVAQSVAKALAAQRPINQYRTQVLEREIVRVPDYSRCVHSDAAFGVLNDALADKPVAARDLGVPEAHPDDGQLFRGNDKEATRSDSNVLRMPTSGGSDR